MITLRVWFLVITTAMSLAVGAWTAFAKPVHAQLSHVLSSAVGPPWSSRATPHTPVRSSNDSLDEFGRETEPHFDLYGNVIEDAVSDYRLDPAGDVYERHSPETEVPRLAPPIS